MRTFAAVLGAAMLAACSGDDTSGPGPGSDFDLIRAEVFEKSCAFSSCHGPAAAGGLVLTGGDVHARLVDADPTNAAARAAGLRRVTAGEPDRSLLWHKLNWTAGHHGEDYGAPMPFGGPALSVERVEFIRRWIAGGASATSRVVDRVLLGGTTPQDVTPFAELPVPASGFQMKVGPFVVDPGTEREIFIYRGLGNATTAYVNRVEIAMRPGSHHFVAYTFAEGTSPVFIPPRDVVRDLYLPSGAVNVATLLAMPNHVFMAGAQTQMYDYRFPAGVALEFGPGAAIDLNSHYVNSTAAPRTGEVFMNLHTVPAAEVAKVARALNLSNFDIVIPPGRDTTVTRTFTFPRTTTVFMLTSHMHKRGLRFVVKIFGGARHGEEVFSTTDWQSPPIVTFDQPIVLQAGQGLTSEVTYRGDPTRTVRFGLTSDDEMGIIAGYWY